MKKILLFFFVLNISISAEAQTFIGMTKDEIIKLQAKDENKLSSSQHDSVVLQPNGRKTLANSMTFKDSKYPITHFFNFTEKNICNGYFAQTSNKSAKDSIQKNFENNFEKIADNSWVQKINGNLYGWQLQGTDKVFIFTTTQLKQY